MPLDSAWPNITNPLHITEADHAAHRSPVGVPYPQDLVPGMDGRKAVGQLMKAARKPALAMKSKSRMLRKKKR